MGALSAFNPFEPTYIGIPTDDNGVIPDALEDLLVRHRVKFIYLCPTFQNPTGRTIPVERRREIATIVCKHGTLLVEDDPYSELRYHGEPVPPIQTFAPDNTVYISTFSKILSPGMRLGFCVAPELMRKWMVLAKQGVDLHTSSFDQAIATEYIRGPYLKEHLPRILDLYRPRLRTMLDTLNSTFPEDFTWSRPEGGMFVWVEGPRGFDAERFYWNALEHSVAIIPGRYCFTKEREGESTMRLNFTLANPDVLSLAVTTLADVIRHELN
jgi:2-aminoadipate transaminase